MTIPEGNQRSTSIRLRVGLFVGALVLVSVLGSAVSLYQITRVNRTLDSINRTAVPLAQLLAKMRSDSEIFKRELERRLSVTQWKEPSWRPQNLPQWIEDIFKSEIDRARELAKEEGSWTDATDRERFSDWVDRVDQQFRGLQEKTNVLYGLLSSKNPSEATTIYPQWSSLLDQWSREVRFGAREAERSIRKSLSGAEDRVSQLRTGLQIVLAGVILLSLFLLWLGERALRPLSELTDLARDITRRGLKREDKDQLPHDLLNRSDEVSQLALEFRRMATALLEREKTVEAQKSRLEEQNKMERQLQERLRIAEHLAGVGRLSAQVAHEVRNPLHSIGLEAEMALEACQSQRLPVVKQAVQSILTSVDRLEKITDNYLKLSRLSAGERGRCHLLELLQSVLATYAPVCESQGVQVDWKSEEGGNYWVMGDAEALEQVFGNLFRNSLQAIEGRGNRIRWSAGNAESGRVWIRIEDDGPGIDQEIQDKLFRPFVTTKAQGTGLGLSFVKQVIEDHGGQIQYQKAIDQGGACFEIFLPTFQEVKNKSDDQNLTR